MQHISIIQKGHHRITRNFELTITPKNCSKTEAMAETQATAVPNRTNGEHDLGNGKKQILLNAFDMSTIGHLSPGQWKVRL